MFEGSTILVIALGYVSALFALAWAGDRYVRPQQGWGGRPLIYALSLATYCTSWTFFGSVGLAAETGYDFIPVYLGPILMFTIGLPLVMRIVRLSKAQNITSVADFLASRYGKSHAVAAVVTCVVVIGSLPYIALQLKAVAVSVETIVGGSPLVPIEIPRIGFADTNMLITAALALFAILFGTRHVATTEHQHGLMLAIAAESLVKLTAFLAVGLFVVFGMFGSFDKVWESAASTPAIAETFSRQFDGGTWLTVTLLSFVCVILLPRQFHVAVVENNTPMELRRAAWLFPLYLILINLFVVPIAIGGLMLLTPGSSDPDFFVLTLPIQAEARSIALIAFVGGLSAATAMLVVESIALAIMVSNGLVVPLLLRNRLTDSVPQAEMARLLLIIRRCAIIAVFAFGYLIFALLADTQGLAAIGLISFAGIAQLAPAFFGGLVWRHGTARGAIAGILAGFAIWAYTLVLPWVIKSGLIPPDILLNGPFGIAMLRPQALFFLQFDPLTHGVIWSLAANTIAYVAVSLMRAPEPIERLQAGVFVQEDKISPMPVPAFKLWRSNITAGDLQSVVARYVGSERAERSFAEYATTRGITLNRGAEADVQLIRFTEHVLTSSIGAASARLVLSLLLRRSDVTGRSALKLLDDASEALQYNRDLLQSALDQVRHGLSVFDKDMRLICWNRQFREILNLPPEVMRVGAPLDRILRALAVRGQFGEGDPDELVADRLMKLAVTKQTFQEQLADSGRILEVRTSPMPQGGIVTTYSDITDRVAAASALARANETLERRVRERTAELLEVNAALAVAKSQADQANQDKTRFLAAASHDILQPLNAARLYATSLNERPLEETEARLARNVDASLSAVEEIFSALIDISRMDAGRLDADVTDFPVSEILEQLRVEYEPLAAEKGLKLRVRPSSAWVRSDRRMFRRVVQNLFSNAIKYTRSGGVLLGARRRGDRIVIEVHDTGPGIPEDKQEMIFKEFHRLEGSGSRESGLGLGLSIVERIGRILGHEISLNSTAGRGSTFAVYAPKGEPAAVKPSATRQQAGRPGSLTGCRVLCIDNEDAVVAGMEALLTGWGCTVTLGGNAQNAVRAVAGSERAPDIILADYHLDFGTGPEAIDKVRESCGVDIPAIVITADHSPEVERDIRGRGLGLLRKPLKAAALRALLNQTVIAHRQTAAE